MKLDNSPLCQSLGQNSALQVLSFLLAHKDFDYSKTEIAENVELSRQTMYKALEPLTNFSMVIESRKIGKITMYQLNEDSELVKTIRKFNKLIVHNIRELEKEQPINSTGDINDIKRAFR